MRAWVVGLVLFGLVGSLAPVASGAYVGHQNGLITFAASPCGGSGCHTIYVTDDRGTTARAVTAPQFIAAQYPAFSPDGFHIAWSGLGLDITDVSGANPFEIFPNYFLPSSWMPDGRDILFVNGASVGETDLAGHAGALFTPPPQPGMSSNGLQDVAASPDGRRVALTLATAAIDPNSRHSEIFVSNIDGSSLHQVTSTPVVGGWDGASLARWSPDGTRLIYQIDPAGTIATVSANGGAATVVKAGDGYRNTYLQPSFSPDGTQILYDGPRGIARANVDGSGEQAIPAAVALQGGMPNWGPSPSCAVVAAYPTAFGGFDIGACANASASTG